MRNWLSFLNAQSKSVTVWLHMRLTAKVNSFRRTPKEYPINAITVWRMVVANSLTVNTAYMLTNRKNIAGLSELGACQKTRCSKMEPRSLTVVLLKLQVCQSSREIHKTISLVSFQSDFDSTSNRGVAEKSTASVSASSLTPNLVSAAATSLLDTATNIALLGNLGSELATLPIDVQIATQGPIADTQLKDHPTDAAIAAAHVCEYSVPYWYDRLTITGCEESSGPSASADLTTHHHGHVAAPAARAAPAINDVPLLTGCDLYSAQEVTHAVDDLGVAAGILRRRAEDIRAGIAVAPIGPAPPPRQSRSRSPSRRRGFQFWSVVCP